MIEKIIDFHTHTFPDRIAEKAVDALKHASHSIAFTDGTNAGLIASMKESGITASVILPVATSPLQVEKVNDTAVHVNRTMRDQGLISLGCMHPEYRNYEDELKRIRDLGIRGIKIHPVYQDADIDSPEFIRIIRCAADLGMFVVTHAGKDIGFPGVFRCSPLMCRHVVEEVGRFGFVLAHMGGWKMWDEVPEILADTGVYLDTAFSTGRYYPLPDDPTWSEKDCELLDQEGFMRLLDTFGRERIIFGTDCPWSLQAETVHFIRDLPVDDETKEYIFCRNAERLLK